MTTVDAARQNQWRVWRANWLQVRHRWCAARRQILVYRAGLASDNRDIWRAEADRVETAQLAAGLELLRLHGFGKAGPQQTPAAGAARPCVLVVDANREDRLTIRNALQAAGWDVDLAAGPSQAVRLALRHRPDVALIEVSRDMDDAMDLVLGLRCEYGEELPIVGTCDDDDRELAQALGIKHFWRKAFPIDLLIDQLSAAARATEPRDT